jgi:hypothetical protein
MNKLYNFIWNFTMLGALALTCLHLWMNKQALLNSLYQASLGLGILNPWR